MSRSATTVCLVCNMFGLASLAIAGGYIDLDLSSASTAAGSVQVSVYTLPDGTGWPLNAVRWSPAPGQSAVIDATVTLTLRDQDDNPVPYFPAEDMWLETTLGGLRLCPGGSMADHHTDINGQTTWSRSVYGGGYTNPDAGERTIVLISGQPLMNSPMNIQWNSPDIDGNLTVNLTDIVRFQNAYWAWVFSGVYSYFADFVYNQWIGLPDIVHMKGGFGRHCP